MGKQSGQTSPRGLVRMAGILYLASFAIPVAIWVFLFSGRFDGGESRVVVQNLIKDELVFRYVVLGELLTGVVIAGLGLSLFAVLEKEGLFIARCALVFRSLEAFLTAAIGLSHHAALLLLKSESVVAAPMHAETIGAFVGAYREITSVPGVLFGLSMMLFTILLTRTALVPRHLARFGVVSYALVIAYDVLCILAPEWAAQSHIQAMGTAPVCLYTIVVGFWLIFARAGHSEEEEGACSFSSERHVCHF